MYSTIDANYKTNVLIRRTISGGGEVRLPSGVLREGPRRASHKEGGYKLETNIPFNHLLDGMFVSMWLSKRGLLRLLRNLAMTY
jgi:hypothetical protein